MLPKVAVCTILRDAARRGHLARFIRQVEALAWPRERLRVYCLEGDSADDTYQRLCAWASWQRYVRVRQKDCAGPLWDSVENTARFMQVSQLASECRAWALEDGWADYILWIESDLIWEWELLVRLWQNRVDIVAPWIWGHWGANGQDDPYVLWGLPREGRFFYDTWAYRHLDGQRFSQREHWPKEPFRVASAGSCLLMTAEAAARSNEPNEEAIVGWCKQARAAGYDIWVDPDTVIWHPWPREGTCGRSG